MAVVKVLQLGGLFKLSGLEKSVKSLILSVSDLISDQLSEALFEAQFVIGARLIELKLKGLCHACELQLA